MLDSVGAKLEITAARLSRLSTEVSFFYPLQNIQVNIQYSLSIGTCLGSHGCLPPTGIRIRNSVNNIATFSFFMLHLDHTITFESMQQRTVRLTNQCRTESFLRASKSTFNPTAVEIFIPTSPNSLSVLFISWFRKFLCIRYFLLASAPTTDTEILFQCESVTQSVTWSWSFRRSVTDVQV